MNYSEILNHVDHTILKAFTTWEQIEQICEESIEYKTASICIPPSYISRIKQKYGDAVNICTVIGFPLGYNTTAVKVAEVKEAIADGANEVDMVVNLGDVKNGDFDKVTEEIKALKEAAGSKVLKVIIEACYLTDEEKVKLCHCVTEAKADYIKTSTGFGTGGATLHDIKLFKENIGPDVKMKAAGGIHTLEEHEAFLNEGCDRLGSSAAVGLVKAALAENR